MIPWLIVPLALAVEPPSCRASVGDLRRAWRDLAVLVPVAPELDAELQHALDAVAEHGAIEVELRQGRRRSRWAEVPATVERARAWLDRNPAASGVEAVRAALDPTAAACGAS